jgi:iron complex transport system permease protein
MKIPIPVEKHTGIFIGLFVVLLVVAIVSILGGRYPEPGLLSVETIREDRLASQILLNLRLPRVLAAILVGMTLSVAGLVFQQTFSNPLVEPGFLGITPGAAFGAAIAIITFSGNVLAIQIISAAFAFAGLGLSVFISSRINTRDDRLSLVFSGIIVSALFSSGLGIVKYLADPYSQLPEITFWLLGGLWSVTWQKFLPIILPVIISLVILILFRWRLNLLGLDDQVSHSIGFDVRREKRFFLFITVLGTALITSIAGIISWVGLIIPTIARILFGGNMKQSLPASLLLGGLFVLACDSFGRIFFTGEIPLGILTSLLGCLAFLWIVTRKGLKDQ